MWVSAGFDHFRNIFGYLLVFKSVSLSRALCDPMHNVSGCRDTGGGATHSRSAPNRLEENIQNNNGAVLPLISRHVNIPLSSHPTPPSPDEWGGGERDGDGVEVAEVGDDHQGGLPPHALLLLIVAMVLLPLAQSCWWQAVCHPGRPGAPLDTSSWPWQEWHKVCKLDTKAGNTLFLANLLLPWKNITTSVITIINSISIVIIKILSAGNVSVWGGRRTNPPLSVTLVLQVIIIKQ